MNWLAGIQLLAVLGQFYVLSRSTLWYQSISVVVMSSINYYLLFRLLRERWAVQASMKKGVVDTIEATEHHHTATT